MPRCEHPISNSASSASIRKMRAPIRIANPGRNSCEQYGAIPFLQNYRPQTNQSQIRTNQSRIRNMPAPIRIANPSRNSCKQYCAHSFFARSHTKKSIPNPENVGSDSDCQSEFGIRVNNMVQIRVYKITDPNKSTQNQENVGSDSDCNSESELA